jgi:hypothetical protein
MVNSTYNDCGFGVQSGSGRHRVRRVRRGRGFFGDVFNKIKDIGSAVLPILKSTGIAGNLISRYNPNIGSVVKSLGYGRRRVHRRRRVLGGSVTRAMIMKRLGMGRARRVRKRRVGRGIIGDLLGSIGLGRKRRIRRR